MSASTTIDLPSRFVSDLSACPTIDRTAHTVTWTAAAGGVAPNLQFVDFHSPGAGAWSYSVVGPATPVLQLPTLPTDVFDFNIRNNASAILERMVLTNSASGYDAVRDGATWMYPTGPEVLDTLGSVASLQVSGSVAGGCP